MDQATIAENNPDQATLVQRVASLAEAVLWPAAGDVDSGRVPVLAQLDHLAAAGLYGLAVPTDQGGLGASDTTFREVVRTLASADLTSTFVWIQHQGATKRVVRSSDERLRREWLADLAGGEVRAGVGVGGVRPPIPTLAARPDGAGWVLEGTIPWVTGWGLVDVLLVAARVDEADPAGPNDPTVDPRGLVEADVVWLLVDAPRPIGATDRTIALDDPAITADRYDLVALDHSVSAAVRCHGLRVGPGRMVARQRADEWAAADAAGLRTNGSLALGLADRCVSLLDEPTNGLEDAISRVAGALEVADIPALPAARAAAAELAWSAAGRLLVARGGRSVARQDPAQRLAREAMVLQVFGTRAAITERMLQDSEAALEQLFR